jgi:alanine-glyoxylate transaminase/serine-glyoxylate transaminase/serine-pyruvate transaminase
MLRTTIFLYAILGDCMSRAAGRHFLQIPGPTNVPDRVLRAIDFPTMDHRSPDFGLLGKTVLEGMKRVFKTAATW